MSGITFGGLASGMDTSAVIDALVEAARAPINRLQSRQASANSRISKIGSIVSKLSTLQDAVTELDTIKEFSSFSVNSSDETRITASADGTASPGAYQLEVTSLANAERTYSNAFASKDTTGAGVGTGTLTIQVGSETAVDIAVDDSADSLNDIAAKINDAVAGVNANVIYDGSQYRLLVQGEETGAANAISFTETGVTLGLDDPDNQAQAATDAAVVLDTLGSGSLTVTSSNNVISGAIPGVTLNIHDLTAGTPVSVKVASDVDGVVDKVKGMVDAYNAVNSALSAEMTFGGTAYTDSLVGDSALRTTKRQLQMVLTGQVGALAGDYDALWQVGVSTDRTGQLVLDEGKLRTALAGDFEGVAQLFAYDDGVDGASGDGMAARLDATIEQLINSEDGILDARKDGLQDVVDDIDDQIMMLERRVENYEGLLVRQFMALEEAMSGFNAQGNFLAAQNQ